MHYVGVIETPEYVQYGICFTDVCKKLVPEAFSFAGSFHETCYIYYFYCCRHHSFRMAQLFQDLESLVRDYCGSYVRFYGAEREIGTLGLSGTYTVEQCGFPYIRKSYDTAFQ